MILDNLDRLDMKSEAIQNAIIELRRALAPVSTPQDLGSACPSESATLAPCSPVEQRLVDAIDRLDSFAIQINELRELLELGEDAKAAAERAFADRAHSDMASGIVAR